MEERKKNRLKEIKRRKRGGELTERETSGHTARQRAEICVFCMIEWTEGEEDVVDDGGI